jgi:phosphatidylinositol alpha-mannosyltransferase
MDDPERRGPEAPSRPGRAESDSSGLAGRAKALRDRLTDHSRRSTRRAGLVLVVLLLAGLSIYALSRLNLGRVGHVLITATPGWIVLALALMAGSLLLRSISWHEALRAALPDTQISWAAVIRATMIGVMASAVVPGRIGEPTRIVVLSRRLEGAQRRLLPIVTGTVFSQTLINLLALAILASITFSSIPIFHGGFGAILGVAAIPLALCGLVLVGPLLLRLAARAPSLRMRLATAAIARLLGLARQGLAVFVTPRHGVASVTAQLCAWALQWLACYGVVRALGLPAHPQLIAAAAVLLAVNVSAILPATPSNVGVFQAACLVVLAAYGVGAGQAIAYGIVLQAVEVVTALGLGIPALLGEGLTWRDIRGAARAGEDAGEGPGLN